MSGLSGREYTITAGGHAATIVEVGAGLKAYRYGGVDVTCTYPDDTLPPKCCGVTLVPWPNRIRGARYEFAGVTQQLAVTEPKLGNAIHGLGRWARWQLVEQADDVLVLRLDVVPQNGYPFEVRVDVTYRVDETRGLSVTTAATNTGRGAAPFGAGAHPYLATHGHPLEDVTVRLDAGSVLVADEAQLPVGRRAVDGTPHDLRSGVRLRGQRFDDGFTDVARDDAGRGFAEVRTPSGGARLWFDAAYGFVQVFTVDRLTDAGAGVAVEPMSCPADAFNSRDGLVVLEPGQRWAGVWGVQPL